MDTTNTTPVRFMMVADIHNSGTDGLDPAGCDAAIVAGDFKFHGWSSCHEEWKDKVNDDPFFKWCNGHPKLPVFLIPGNHDRVVERCPDWVKWPKNVVRLDAANGAVEFRGLKIWGAPWSLEHSRGSVYSCSEDDLAEKFSAMPEGLDVLVLHCPPKLTDAEGGADKDVGDTGAHFGSESIRKAVLAKKPRLVVCGHIHQGTREPAKLGETIVVNAGRVRHKSDKAPSFSPAYVTFNPGGTLDVTPAKRL